MQRERKEMIYVLENILLKICWQNILQLLHSSGDLRNRQMDGQDEENIMIYNQGFFTKRRTAIGKTQGSSIGGVSEEERRRNHPRPRTEDEP